MKITTAIVYDHRGRAKADENGQLEVRVTCDRRSYYVCTGIRVARSSFVAGRVVNCHGADQFNERLAIVYQRVLEEVNAAIKDGVKIDVEDIRRKVWRDAEMASDKPTLLDWVEEQIDTMNHAEGTLKHYRTLLLRMTEFGKMKRWQDVSVENVCDFDTWLHRMKNYRGGKLTDGAIYNYHKCLKALLNRADTMGKIERNPYERLKGKFKRGDRENVEYLTEDEMQAFASLAVPTGTVMERARDLFVFQMYTGLSYSDTQVFDFRQYRWDGVSYRHNGERIKTGVPFVSSLLPPAVEVLERNGWRVPQIENADYNHALKLLGQMAGIAIPLHSHLARHTFATWMLRNGAKIENVSRMLGHTNITQTQRYAKVLAQSVHDDFDMVAERIESKMTRRRENRK